MKKALRYGYTLIEMMIGLTVSLIVLASALALFSVNTSMGTQQLQRDFLNTQLNMLATTISNEIKRAGFCFDCVSTNVFMLSDSLGDSSSILIDDSATETKKRACILFAYNHDKRSGALSLDKDDAKGYRLGQDSKNNPVIEVYENWKGLTNWNCGSGSSDGGTSGYWRDMTFDRIVINTLTFQRSSYHSVGSNTNRLQSIDIEIKASLKADSSVVDSVNFSVVVPNVDG
ncbi:PilW family protein [Enterovibrio norvegicus]|uniref:PilW family protein n=1 Tax=Enterovibrio norvegicus TaxID=188144 RepID=UPI00354F80B5